MSSISAQIFYAATLFERVSHAHLLKRKYLIRHEMRKDSERIKIIPILQNVLKNGNIRYLEDFIRNNAENLKTNIILPDLWKLTKNSEVTPEMKRV